jgi:hypothetical protein
LVRRRDVSRHTRLSYAGLTRVSIKLRKKRFLKADGLPGQARQ